MSVNILGLRYSNTDNCDATYFAVFSYSISEVCVYHNKLTALIF